MTQPLWPHSEEALKIMAKYVDVQALVDLVGIERVVDSFGPERLLEATLSMMTTEQKRQLRERLPSEESKEKKGPDGTS